MSLPRMSWHIGDYKKDTGHLRAAGHGAYFLLCMHYWATGGLPDDDKQLAAIACMTSREWKEHRAVLRALFKGEGPWRHKRIDDELADAQAKYEKRAGAGSKGGKAKAKSKQTPSNASSNATAKSKQPITDNHSEAKASAPEALEPDLIDVVDEDPKARLFRFGKTILVSFGVAEARTGALIGQWLKTCSDPKGLLAVIQFARDQNVAEPVAYISAAISNQKRQNGHGKQSLGELAGQLADQLRERESAAGLARSPTA